tara:strand:- start:1534 stop:2181 length:648 start_codon:yes stop_codon:yes gene_type:complete
MYILSIDVGIKNLAHCLVNLENQSYKIILWDSINLSDGIQPKCDHITKKKCCQIAKYCKDDIYYCNKHSKNIVGCIPIKNSNVSDIPLPKLGIKLKEMYDTIFKDYKIDKVIIENQISPLAGRMKTLQGMITQYFIGLNIEDIEYISAQNKLKEYITKKTTYSERKKISIEITKKIIKDSNNWNELFEKSKKKDDLGDTLLQAIYYMKNNNLINA